MAPPSQLKTQIQKTFQLHGFQLRLDACKHLEKLLTPLAEQNHDEVDEWLDQILDVLQKKALDSAVVDKTLLVKAVQECSSRVAGDEEKNVLSIIDAFQVPRFTYSVERKKYLADADLDKSEPKIYADAASKADLFRARYQMLHQRTSRHDLFTPGVAGSSADLAGPSADGAPKKFKLKNVEFLLGTTSKLNDVIVLGMLTQIKHGKYSLEDPTGIVNLDLSETKFHTGLYTENCFVLAEGWYEDEIFHVSAMGFPPAEPAETSRAYFGNLNFFGGPLDHCAKSSSALLKVEKANSDAMFVFLSDVWLDKPQVMAKLSKLFAGYSAMPPTAFVLMGNFLASPYGSQQARVLRDHFKQLGDLLSDYPDLVEHSKFIFVPGPTDPGFANLFPRPALPAFVTEGLRKKLPGTAGLEFTSNPCRVQYCTQEIVLFREDIVTKMCRNSIYFPESGAIPDHFAKTLASQGHLTPLPLHTCPVYWDYDRSLFLYPLPDLVVVGDKFDPFAAEQAKCRVVNPGSFGKNDFAFKTYIPKTRELEDSQVPDEDVAMASA